MNTNDTGSQLETGLSGKKKYINKTTFTKENVKAGPGRTAGYTHYMATLFAEMMDSNAPDGKTPFVIAAIEKYKEMCLKGDKTAMSSFMERTLLNPVMLAKLDGILSGQKNNDLKYKKYQLWERCFDEQQEVLNSKKPIQLLVCGRRAGKTETIATAIVQTAINYDRGDIIYIGKTVTSATEIIWNRLIELLNMVNMPHQDNRSESTITLSSGVVIYVRGANSLADIDKLRGHSYRLAVVDEIQSITHLRILVDEILAPALRDFRGKLILSGTPPRIKGTYVEELWEKAGIENKFSKRFHWTAADNVHMPDNESILQTVLEQNQWEKTNSVFQREWLGQMGVYDVDALVFRPTSENILIPSELETWIKSQRLEELFFSAGLDLGFNDSDAFTIVLGSSNRPEKWVVWEHKKNKQDISQLVFEIHKGLDYVKAEPMFRGIPGLTEIKIFTDTGGGGKKIAVELRQQFRLNTTEAIKASKEFAIAQLQEEIRLGRLKFSADGFWSDECQKIIYSRTEKGDLTKEIDNDSFHPDFMDCLLYSLRPLWLSSETKLGDTWEPKPQAFQKPAPAIFDAMGSIWGQPKEDWTDIGDWEDLK